MAFNSGGLGSLLGMGIGAALAAPTGGLSIPMGMGLGGALGGTAGGLLGGGAAEPPSPWEIYKSIYKKVGPSLRRDILERAAESKAAAGQSLVSRGLGNTTVAPMVAAGIDRMASRELGRLPMNIMGAVPSMTPQYTTQPDNSGFNDLLSQLGFMAGLGLFNRTNAPQTQAGAPAKTAWGAGGQAYASEAAKALAQPMYFGRFGF